ncbi:unnamed protein product [Auanema sp. JU1783]|nr:unnamed protein product [Auanema sp. JU1783]
MRCEIICPSLPSIPTCASYSRRLQTVFAANPLTSYSVNGTATEQLPCRTPVDCLRLSRDERNLAVSTSTQIKLIDLNTHREIRNLPSMNTLPIKTVCPTRSSIYSWVSGSLDSSWTLWDTRCHPANVLHGRVNGPIKCLDVSPNDALLAVGTASSFHLFDIRNRQPARIFPCSAVGVQFNPVQMMLATYGMDRIVRFWCLDQMECVSQSDALSSNIKGIAFSGERDDPENDYLLAATDTELRMLTWEPCDTLSSTPLNKHYSVLELNFTEGVVNLASYGVDKSLAMITYSIEDILSPGENQLSEKFFEFTIEEEGEEEEEVEEDLLLPSDSSTSPSPSSSSGSSCSIQNNNNIKKTDMAVATIPRSAPSAVNSRRTNPLNVSTTVTQKLNSQASTPTGRVTRASSSSRCQRVNSTDALNVRPRSPTEPPVIDRPTRLSLRDRAKSTTTTPTAAPSNQKASKLPPLPTRKPSPVTRSNAKECKDNIVSRNTSLIDDTTMVKTTDSADYSGSELHSLLIKGHHSVMRLLESRKTEAERFSKSIRSGSFDNGILEGDMFVRRRVIQQLTEMKRWDIRLVSNHVVGIKMMLGDAKCIETALDALSFIVKNLADKFKSFANSSAVCGVDVVQEQRKEKAEYIIKELRELVEHRDSYYKSLSYDHVLQLDAIMEYVKEL